MSMSLRSYLSHAILIGLCERRGERFDHLVRPLLDARKKLTGAELRAADKRIASALAQLLDHAAPPAAAHFERDGLAAVESDSYAAELVPIYRERLRDWDAPRAAWRKAVGEALARKGVAARQRRRRSAEAARRDEAQATPAAAPPPVVPSVPPPVFPSEIRA
jgi:hypothetical protein